jgi:hypothetical protein
VQTVYTHRCKLTSVNVNQNCHVYGSQPFVNNGNSLLTLSMVHVKAIFRADLV